MEYTIKYVIITLVIYKIVGVFLLQCILGPAKSGKTECILNKIAELSENAAAQVILIVPEQFSFMCEKLLLQRLGPHLANLVNVYSFTKLCTEIGKEVGGIAGINVDDGMRLLLAGRALKSLKGELKVYTRFYESADFAAHIVDTIQEFKQCGITTDLLREAVKNASNQGFRYKIEDLCLIMDTYNALLQNIFIDPLDHMEAMSKKLITHPFFNGKTVFFDAFKDFTAPQMHLIECILTQAENCYFTFTCLDDALETEQEDITPFSAAQNGVRQLYAVANKNGIKISPAIVLNETHFDTQDMCHVADVLAGAKNMVCAQAENVMVRSLPDIYAEVDFVFCEIARLVRQDGARYRDFAIVTRDAGVYDSAIENYARSYDIPVYFDNRIDIHRLPLFMFVKSAIRSAAHFATEDIFVYLKTGLSNLSTEEISLLENYCFVWGIDRKDWLGTWDMHPNGFDNNREDATDTLQKLNDLRLKVVTPLQKISALKYGTAMQFGQMIFALLNDVNASAQLKKLATTLEETGALEEAQCQYASWDTLMDILDKLDVCLGQDEISVEKFLEYFVLAGKEVTIGSLPEGLDDVIYGTADRIRTSKTKTVFLLGVNQGEFPRAATDTGLLGNFERTQLIRYGVDIKNTVFTRIMDEKYWFYHAVCLASQKAYILYSTADLSGNAKEPSEVVQTISEAFLGCKKTISSAELGFNVEALQAERPAFEKLASVWSAKSTEVAAAKSYFGALPQYRAKMEAIDAQLRGSMQHISPENAKKLYGKDIYMSATRLDMYCKCAFSYFCRYGLKASRLKKAEMDVLLRGTLIHYIFEQILSEKGRDVCSMAHDEILTFCRKAAAKYFEELEIDPQHQTPRFLHMLRQLVELSADLILSIQKELANTDFDPTAFELKIGGDEVAPLNVPLQEGQLYVYGSIDRVDTATVNDKMYVRVMDYKSGTKKFALHDTLYGLNLQMLIYLYAIIKNGNGKYGQYPAGILYKSLKREYVDANKKADTNKMSGILCDDSDVLLAMDKQGQGEVIPAKFNKNGSLHYSSKVLSQEGFSAVFLHIDRVLRNVGDALHAGNISVDPLDSGSEEACKYCDYRVVCRKEEGQSSRKTKGYTITETIEKIRGEENGVSTNASTSQCN